MSPGATLAWRQPDLHMRVLAAASSLPDVLHLADGRLRQCFFVPYPWRPNVRVDVELALQAVDDAVEMALIQCADRDTAGFVAGLHSNGGIFSAKLPQGLRKSLRITRAAGLNGEQQKRPISHETYYIFLREQEAMC
jgi:hypothetical protein